MLAGGPPQPGHSFCAYSPHWLNALCAVPLLLSLNASSSVQTSASVQRASGGKFTVARNWLILSTQSCAAFVYPPGVAMGVGVAVRMGVGVAVGSGGPSGHPGAVGSRPQSESATNWSAPPASVSTAPLTV